jgi:hypothetical protein
MYDDKHRKIVVHDLQGFDGRPEGYVSRADVVTYLLATGRRRDGEWSVRGEDEEDLVHAEGGPLPTLVARATRAEGTAPRSLLRVIETLARSQNGKPPLFRFLRVQTEREGWISITVRDGYALHRVERREHAAIITLRRAEGRR